MLGLLDPAEILQTCSVGSLVVSAKFLGQGVVWFLFGVLLIGKKSSILRNRGHSFCSKRTWKDSEVCQGMPGYLDFYISIEFDCILMSFEK